MTKIALYRVLSVNGSKIEDFHVYACSKEQAIDRVARETGHRDPHATAIKLNQ